MSVAVTVVIPAYHAADYLEKTIESVRHQTLEDFECLVIDDGSIDETATVVQRLSTSDQRIKLISQANQGVAVARNQGIQEAQGEFIAFLDADDLWATDKLEAHVQHLRSAQDLGMSFGRVEFIQEDGNPTGVFSNPEFTNLTPKKLYEKNPAITPSNAVIRKAALEQVGGFDRELSGLADAELFLRIQCQGWRVEGLNRVLVYYRTSVNGMSAQLYSMEADWQRMSDKIKAYAPDLIQEHYAVAESMLLRYLARRSLRLHLPAEIGSDFMSRALLADWKIILKQPRRTLLTMLAVYGETVFGNLGRA
jgi:glycosyltransferase involved in cell wall biosynthesis